MLTFKINFASHETLKRGIYALNSIAKLKVCILPRKRQNMQKYTI
jgi:hypothetical protein